MILRKPDYVQIEARLLRTWNQQEIQEWLNMQCGFTSKEAAYAFLYGASLRRIAETFRV